MIEDDSATVPVIPESTIGAVADALARVRRVFPDGHDITVRSSSGMSLELSAAAAAQLASRLPTGWTGDTILPALGVPSIDRLHAAWDVQRLWIRRYRLRSREVWVVNPDYSRPMYRQVVSQAYQTLPEITRVEYGLMLGDGGGLRLIRTGTGFRFEFTRAWGDCLAGCISRHRWIFEVDARTGRVTKVLEDGTPLTDRPGQDLSTRDAW